ncbi:MAG TPA: hypothetical protein VF992_05560 [Thermoplasmata archaeon]
MDDFLASNETWPAVAGDPSFWRSPAPTVVGTAIAALAGVVVYGLAIAGRPEPVAPPIEAIFLGVLGGLALIGYAMSKKNTRKQRDRRRRRPAASRRKNRSPDEDDRLRGGDVWLARAA